MRKRIVELGRTSLLPESDAGWLNLSEIATSEDEHFAIETVVANDAGSGWRAAWSGKQVIRVLFDKPMLLRHTRLRFDERDSERTQEFTLSWYPAAGGSREIVRQQWNFNQGAVTENRGLCGESGCGSGA